MQASENDLSRVIIGAAIEVHKELGGPGLLEDVYAEALCAELSLRGVPVARRDYYPVIYKGMVLEKKYQLDLMVAGLVVVECKAVEKFHSIHLAQCLTYLKLTGRKLGLVINFGEKFVRDGIHRVVNGL